MPERKSTSSTSSPSLYFQTNIGNARFSQLRYAVAEYTLLVEKGREITDVPSNAVVLHLTHEVNHSRGRTTRLKDVVEFRVQFGSVGGFGSEDDVKRGAP